MRTLFLAFSFLLEETLYRFAIVSNCSMNCSTLLVLKKGSEEIENQLMFRTLEFGCDCCSKLLTL